MKIPNNSDMGANPPVSLARIVSEDSQRSENGYLVPVKSSKDS